MGFSLGTYYRLLSLVQVLSLLYACDLYIGSWIFDDTYPLYDASECPFIERQFNCLENGRTDQQYLKYRWKPSACELPRFDGADMFERFQGKTIMFVGDSLSLNQWQSFTCMLHAAVPQAEYTLKRKRGISTFAFPEYRVKVILVRNAFLVDLLHENKTTVLKLDSISSGKLWLSADMLIFNTWHWWRHNGRQKSWNFIREGNNLYADMDRLVAYEKALTTWANWVDTNIDSTKVGVFFQGVSPDHSRTLDWNETKGRHCSGQEVPLQGSTYPGGLHPAEIVLKRVLNKTSTPVTLLDVTTLSQLRVDGHPSVYGSAGHQGMDCNHWCLAGVPDTWNQLLYASLLQMT